MNFTCYEICQKSDVLKTSDFSAIKNFGLSLTIGYHVFRSTVNDKQEMSMGKDKKTLMRILNAMSDNNIKFVEYG